MPSLESSALHQKLKSSVDFALKKLEDVWNLEDALLSGATSLSEACDSMDFVSKKLKEIQNVLENSDESNWKEANSSVQNWIDKVFSVEIAILDFLKEVGKTIVLPNAVKIISTKPVNFFALHKLGTEMNKLGTEMNNIESSLQRIMTPDALHTIRNDTALPAMGLVGYGALQKSITEKLLDQSTDPECLHVAILGPEGAGKTTLAQKIYQSTEVKKHFDICFWFFDTSHIDSRYPAQFEPIEIMRKMLIKLEPDNSLDNNEEKHIISRISESLKKKRFLVVIDNIQHYVVIKKALPDENNGSRVLIITPEIGNHELVAHNIDAKLNKYVIPLLTHEDRQKLLLRNSRHDTDYLEKCSTDYLATRWVESPMDLVLLGGHLSYYHDIPLDMDATARSSDMIIGVYLYLPSVLKKCFACLATVFPVNYIIPADSLTRLWIAEGITMEATAANSCLDQLIQRGLVCAIQAYYHNQAHQETRVVVLHPKLHDNFKYYTCTNNPFPVEAVLCQDASQLFNYYVDTDDDRILFHPSRRLAVHFPCQFNRFTSFDKGESMHEFKYPSGPSLHSLFSFGSVAPMMFSQFNFLRVLAVYQARIRFSEEDQRCWLDDLVNLRYLGFIVCWIEGGSLGKKLPRFKKLQTLDLSESFISGLSEYIEKNINVKVVGPVNEEFGRCWSPVPDMCQ